MPGYRATIVSDDREWANRAIQVCHDGGAVPEWTDWSEVDAIHDPPAALILDVQPGAEDVLRTLERWATNAWYPVCIISLRPISGAWETQQHLETLGYRRIQHTADHAGYEEELRSTVQQVIDDRAWLVPRAVRAVGCADPAVVEALRLAVIIVPEVSTIERWAEIDGMKSGRGLETLFRRCRVTNPAAIFQWLRLARVVEYAVRQANRPTRKELAERFGYGNEDYLGRRAKTLPGSALGRLLTLGLDSFFDLMAARLGADPEPQP